MATEGDEQFVESALAKARSQARYASASRLRLTPPNAGMRTASAFTLLANALALKTLATHCAKPPRTNAMLKAAGELLLMDDERRTMRSPIALSVRPCRAHILSALSFFAFVNNPFLALAQECYQGDCAG